MKITTASRMYRNTLLSTELSFQVYQPPERLDARIGHAAGPTVKMTGHDVDAPVLRVLQLLKDGSIERFLRHMLEKGDL